MGEGIFRMCLVLMAVVGVNQRLGPSGKNGIVAEDNEEILQRMMKEREVTLQLQQLRLEKEIADLEAPREARAQPASHLQRKIQRHTCAVLGLVVPALLMLCRQHWEEPQQSTQEKDRLSRGSCRKPGKEWPC